MITGLIILFKIAFCLLLADFVTGIGHWIQDRYFHSKLNLIGPLLAVPNTRHHASPRGFLKGTYWQRNDIPICLALVLIPLFWLLGWLSLYVLLTLLLLSQSNEIHACAHRTDKENPSFIRWLQRIGFLQSRRHHGHHHRAPYDCRFCILTDFLNPLLDRWRLWMRLEKLVSRLGIEPTD